MTEKKINEMTDEELKRRALERSERQFRIRRVVTRIRLVFFAVVLIILFVMLFYACHGINSTL